MRAPSAVAVCFISPSLTSTCWNNFTCSAASGLYSTPTKSAPLSLSQPYWPPLRSSARHSSLPGRGELQGGQVISDKDAVSDLSTNSTQRASKQQKSEGEVMSENT